MLQRVYYATPHFLYVIKAVKVILERIKLVKLALLHENADADVSQSYFGPLWCHLQYVFNYKL